MGPGTRFAFQHDAELQPGHELTIFDNAASPVVRPESRGLRLAVDERARTVKLIRAFTHPVPISAAAEGSMQRLSNGDYFVSWGLGGAMSEFRPDGSLAFDARLPAGIESYRGYRIAGWHGRPTTRPAVAARRHGPGLTAWASWNGATGVARWQVLVGRRASALAPAGDAARQGFETALGIPRGGPFVAVRALDAAGHALGTSRVIRAS
jgi:arylsulfotransferase ASST